MNIVVEIEKTRSFIVVVRVTSLFSLSIEIIHISIPRVNSKKTGRSRGQIWETWLKMRLRQLEAFSKAVNKL